MTMTDISRAASAPLAMSLTIARETTTPEDAAMPCTKRPTSISSMLLLIEQATPAAVNIATPTYNTGILPKRSDSRPAGICPSASPAMKVPTICWPDDSVVPSACTIAGMAGRLISIDNAARPVREPSTRTNRFLPARPVFMDKFAVGRTMESGQNSRQHRRSPLRGSARRKSEWRTG